MDVSQLTEQLIRGHFVEVEASGRHVHLTAQDARTLFGHSLTFLRELSQPGQFVSRERVRVVGPKGVLERVAVLGPERSESQVELSRTDCIALGIDAPVRLSGSIAGTPGCTLKTEHGSVEMKSGVIVAKRHIHMTPQDAAARGIHDGQYVRLRCLTERPVTFENVVVRVREDFATYAHIDYDEANACGLMPGELAVLEI